MGGIVYRWLQGLMVYKNAHEEQYSIPSFSCLHT